MLRLQNSCVSKAICLVSRHACGGSGLAGGLIPGLSCIAAAYQPSAGLATATQQIVKVTQQEQQSGGSSGGPSWGKLLAGGAAAAAAAVAGWTVWLDNAAKHAKAQAEESSKGIIPHSSLRAQGALVSCFAGPLVSLLRGTNPTKPQLQVIAQTLADESSRLMPWELLDALWGLAMFGAELNPQQLQALTAAAASHMQQLTVYQAIVTAWAITMLTGSSSSSSSSSSSGSSGIDIWHQLLQRLKSAEVQDLDEAAVLYLLHASVQQAAAAAAARSGGPATTPRPTEAEVLQQLEVAAHVVHRRIKSKVASAYHEFVPFQQYIEGPYLTILHIAKSLPSHIAAAAAVSAAAAASPYTAAFGGFSTADADAASTVVADAGTLSKLRRNLYFSWRSDELLDRHQQNLNQVLHVLQRRLLLPVQQPSDVDALLPTLRAAIFLDDDMGRAAASTQSSSSSSSINHPATEEPTQAAAAAAATGMPFDPNYWATCHDALQLLMRNRYSAPPGGFHSKSTAGIRAAKARCLQQRGWHVVHVELSEVEGCMGAAAAAAPGQRRGRSAAADYSALEALLRARLQL